MKVEEYPPEHGNIKNQVGSYDKAKKLDWCPGVPLSEGIRKTIRWLEDDKR
jgi:nucleoside-diphosphate-sugar epimerase